MTEPVGKLENWCHRLVEAYLADLASDTEDRYVAKGLDDDKLALQPRGGTNTLASAEERAREDERGHAGGAEAEDVVEEVTPSPELLQLIEKVQPPTTTRGESLVPTTLPWEVKTNIYSVTREQFSKMYKLDTALARVEEHTVSRSELICMYLKSFHNILHYELYELRSHRQYFDRIVSFCAHVLQDLVEELFPGQQFTDIEPQLIDDLRPANGERTV